MRVIRDSKHDDYCDIIEIMSKGSQFRYVDINEQLKKGARNRRFNIRTCRIPIGGERFYVLKPSENGMLKNKDLLVKVLLGHTIDLTKTV